MKYLEHLFSEDERIDVCMYVCKGVYKLLYKKKYSSSIYRVILMHFT